MNIENKVKVVICGKEYNLRTDEKPEYIKGLADRINKEIGDMVKAKPNFGIQNAAVFVALTSLDEAAKAQESIENIRGQIKTYVSEAGKARSANEKLTAKVKELEQKIAALEKENKELKKRPALYDCEQLVLENTVTPSVTIYAQELDTEAQNAQKAEEKSEKPADAADEAVKPNETKEKNDKKEPAADGEGASCGEKSEEAKQEERGEVAGGSPEGNAEAQGNGGDTQSDNLTAPEKPAQQSRRGRKKKR